MNKRKMPDCELGEPKRKFSETFHAVTLLKQKYFPDELPVDKNENV